MSFSKLHLILLLEIVIVAMINHLHALLARQEGGPPPGPPRSPEYLAENQAPRLLAVEGTLFALAISTVLMRFYVRIFMLKTFGWDGKCP